jgi:hypothetical protein
LGVFKKDYQERLEEFYRYVGDKWESEARKSRASLVESVCEMLLRIRTIEVGDVVIQFPPYELKCFGGTSGDVSLIRGKKGFVGNLLDQCRESIINEIVERFNKTVPMRMMVTSR